MVLSAVLPGAGLGKKATQIIKLAKVIPIYISQGGSSYRDSIKQGFTEDEANSYATLNSMVSAGLEYTFGAIGGSELTKGLVGKGTKLITKYLGRNTDDVIRAVSKLELVKQWAKNTVGSAIGESIEEFSEAVLQPLAENIAYRGRAGYNFTENPIDIKPEYFERALMGFVTGGVLGGASGDTKNHNNTQVAAQDTDVKNVAKNLNHEDLNTKDDAEIYAFDDEITKRHAEQLRIEGVSEEAVNSYIEQSKKGQTSKQSAMDHIMQVQTEMGDMHGDVNSSIGVPTNENTATAENKTLYDQSEQKFNKTPAIDQIKTKDILTDNDINAFIENKTAFTDEQLDNMNNLQLFHALRTLSFEADNAQGKINYDDILSLRDKGDVEGMKTLVKEFQGDGNSNSKQTNALNENSESDTIHIENATHDKSFIDDINKPYSRSRPPYAEGQVQQVWENAKDPTTYKVYDPTGVEIVWDKSKSRNGQWDMGHLPEQKYADMHKRYMSEEISKDEFLAWYSNPKNYRTELRSTNRGHQYE